jgi:hypothetical protein
MHLHEQTNDPGTETSVRLNQEKNDRNPKMEKNALQTKQRIEMYLCLTDTRGS